MPDARGRPLPGEVLDALKNPQVTQWLRNLVINQGSAASIGRVPGFESAQNDQYVYPDDADATFAYNFDYVIPSNFQRLVSAKLSFKIRPFRSYNNFSATATGAESGHTHSHSHTSASHAHSLTLDNNSSGSAVIFGSTPTRLGTGGGGTDSNSINATTPGNTGINAQGSSGHTHPVSTTSTLGIFEDTAPANPAITVSVDGTDVTSQLKPAGPYNADQVELDVTQVLKTGPKVWHLLSLQPNQRVRITGILRISYYVDSRLAQ